MIVMTPDAGEAQVAAVRARLEETGVHVLVMPGELTTAIGAIRWMRAAPAGDVALRAAPLLLLAALVAQGLAESRPLIELGFALLVAFAWLLPARSRSQAVAA